MSGTMYLGAAYFDGDPDELLLPVPRVSGLGDIQVAHVRQAIRP